mmetsp:Transcript_122537/g.347418  ORF Transcript_122537/g.347418 Transcript_122537/m.347418 type:complete len:345 (+) Transcript_122537:1546-2580(+)
MPMMSNSSRSLDCGCRIVRAAGSHRRGFHWLVEAGPFEFKVSAEPLESLLPIMLSEAIVFVTENRGKSSTHRLSSVMSHGGRSSKLSPAANRHFLAPLDAVVPRLTLESMLVTLNFLPSLSGASPRFGEPPLSATVLCSCCVSACGFLSSGCAVLYLPSSPCWRSCLAITTEKPRLLRRCSASMTLSLASSTETWLSTDFSLSTDVRSGLWMEMRLLSEGRCWPPASAPGAPPAAAAGMGTTGVCAALPSARSLMLWITPSGWKLSLRLPFCSRSRRFGELKDLPLSDGLGAFVSGWSVSPVYVAWESPLESNFTERLAHFWPGPAHPPLATASASEPLESPLW